MNRDEYDTKMQLMVGDEETYERLIRDPTNVTLKRINSIIDKWYNEGYIEKAQKAKLKLFNCNPPRVYGLPKTHKEGRPLRIIVSTIGTATYRMAKYLSSVLNNVVGKTPHHIVNSFQFVIDIRNQKIQPDTILFSLDVVSLFTNVPVDFALQCIDQRWNEIEDHTSIEKSSFMEMLKVVLESTFFQYNGSFYKQTFGIPMGSPLSPVVANIVLERIEQAALEELQQRGIKPIFFRRYVDDCLMGAKAEQVEEILSVFNGFHPRMQFTVETETDGQLKFLDTIMRRSNENISTEWFPKDPDSRYLDFKSVSPYCHKKNTVIALVDRALKLTDANLRQKTLGTVKTMLENNHYPSFLVENIIKQRLHKMYNTLEGQNQPTSKQYVTIPYINGLGEKLAKYLKQYNIDVAYKPIDKIKDILFTKTKDKISKDKNTNVVYEIGCSQCQKSYIGETSQFLQKRIEQHKYTIKTKTVGGTGLAQHTFETGHIFKFDKAKILDKITNYNTRIIAETFHIKSRGDENVVNKQRDSITFKAAYNPIIRKLEREKAKKKM